MIRFAALCLWDDDDMRLLEDPDDDSGPDDETDRSVDRVGGRGGGSDPGRRLPRRGGSPSSRRLPRRLDSAFDGLADDDEPSADGGEAEAAGGRPPTRPSRPLSRRSTSGCGGGGGSRRRTVALSHWDDGDADATEEISNFHASDLYYQMDERFCPNKLGEWDASHPEHLQENEMILLNAAHRHEVQSMRDALRAVHSRPGPLPAWAIESIQACFGSHYEWTMRRALTLTAYVYPLYETRFYLPAAVRDAQSRQEEDLHRLARLVDSLEPGTGGNNKAGGSDSVFRRLLGAWDEYEEHVELWSCLMENIVLMLYRTYFSLEDHVGLMRETNYLGRMSPHAVGALVHCAGGVERLLWSDGRQASGDMGLLMEVPDIEGKYKEYVENILPGIEALRSGVPRTRKGWQETSSGGNRHLLATKQLGLFNPLDSRYQKDPRFSPDRLPEWERECPNHVKDGIMAIWHNAHICEVRDMKRALHCVAGRGHLEAWSLELIQTWWKCHHEWVLSAVSLFQQVWIPFFETRIHYPPIVKKTQDNWISHVHQVNDIVASLEVGDTIWQMYDLLDAWADYEEAVNISIDLVETMAIMLNHAYFSKDEIASMFKADEVICHLSKYAVGSFLYHAGMDELEDRVKVTSEKMGATFFWNAHFACRHKEYTDTVVIHVNALKAGAPPKDVGVIGNLLSAVHGGLQDEAAQTRSVLVARGSSV